MIKVSRITAVVCLIIAVLSGCRDSGEHAADPADQSTKIDQLLRKEMGKQQIPGLAVAVLRDGKTVHQGVLGLADIQQKKPVTPSTPFQLASTTKTFSSVAVMLLVRDGHFALDDPIGKLLDGLPSGWQGVTVRQLLSHTSGLPDVAVRPGEAELIADQWEVAFPILEKAPLQFPPGEGWSYNQTNYVLLAQIIKRMSGRPINEFMRARLFEPLGMNDTFFPALDGGERRCATNYEPSEAAVKPRSLEFPEFVQAAAGLCTSLQDMIRWNMALDEGRVLPGELLQELWTPPALSESAAAAGRGNPGYALGWAVDQSAGQRSAGHSGGNSTAYRRYLDDGVTVIVLHNGMADPDDLVLWTSQIVRSDDASGPQERLWDASSSGDTEKIAAALDAGADINALDTRRSGSGRRPLNWAASKNHPEAVRLLLQRGAAVDAVNRTGFTALHHAAESGATEVAKDLLAAGANRELKNESGEHAADVARRKGHEALAKLIEDGAPK